jgi:hypothetical protein
MLIYRHLSVLWFLWRYKLIKGPERLDIGLGALRQLYLINHKPWFKSSENELLLAFRAFLPYKRLGGWQGETDFILTINARHTLLPEINSEESSQVLKIYDVHDL